VILACAALAGCASQKSREDLAEDRSIEAERLLMQANEAMDRLEADSAEEKLAEAREVLSDPAAKHWPDHSFQMQDLQAKEERLEAVKAELLRVRLEEQVKAQTAKVDELVKQLDLALKPLTGRDGAAYTKSRIEEATDVRSDIIERLNEGVDLEKRSQSYQEFAKSIAERLKAVPEVIDAANRAVAFNEGPVASSKRARELMDDAKKEDDPKERAAKLIEAKGELDRCANGATEVAKEASLAKVRFDDGGKKTTAKVLAQSCQKRAKALKTQIAQLEKKAKAKAKAKPAKSKKRK
jgi:hypothetical protein